MESGERHAPRGPVKGDPKGPQHLMEAISQQCTATSKTTGEQCKQPAIPGGTVCYYHGGAAPQVKAAAIERLKALQPTAVDTLEALLTRKEFPTVQFQASRFVIEITEGKAIERIEAKVTNATEMTDEQLRQKAQELIALLDASGR